MAFLGSFFGFEFNLAFEGYLLKITLKDSWGFKRAIFGNFELQQSLGDIH